MAANHPKDTTISSEMSQTKSRKKPLFILPRKNLLTVLEQFWTKPGFSKRKAMRDKSGFNASRGHETKEKIQVWISHLHHFVQQKEVRESTWHKPDNKLSYYRESKGTFTRTVCISNGSIGFSTARLATEYQNARHIKQNNPQWVRLVPSEWSFLSRVRR